MKAAFRRRYGGADCLSIEEATMSPVGDDDVLVEVRAASLNAADLHLMHGYPFPARLAFGIRRPRSPAIGCDFAGVVRSVGKNISRYKPGDAVFGDASSSGFGSFAQYLSIPSKYVEAMPKTLDFVQSAALPMAAVTALKGLRIGGLKSGHSVLVLGASGGVGSFAAQIAKAWGARVHCVVRSSKRSTVDALRPDRIIESEGLDLSHSGEKYDVIFDAAAYQPFTRYKKVLAPEGQYILAGGDFGNLLRIAFLGPLYSLVGKQKFMLYLSTPSAEQLGEIRQMAEAGQITPVIDCCFQLAELPDAVRHMESRRTKGKIIIQMPSG